MKWVSILLGLADPALTLRVYALPHPSEVPNLGFRDIGAAHPDAPIRTLGTGIRASRCHY